MLYLLQNKRKKERVMYEYTIWNPTTQEERIIFGYSFNDAVRRYKIDASEVQIIDSVYID